MRSIARSLTSAGIRLNYPPLSVSPASSVISLVILAVLQSRSLQSCSLQIARSSPPITPHTIATLSPVPLADRTLFPDPLARRHSSLIGGHCARSSSRNHRRPDLHHQGLGPFIAGLATTPAPAPPLLVSQLDPSKLCKCLWVISSEDRVLRYSKVTWGHCITSTVGL